MYNAKKKDDHDQLLLMLLLLLCQLFEEEEEEDLRNNRSGHEKEYTTSKNYAGVNPVNKKKKKKRALRSLLKPFPLLALIYHAQNFIGIEFLHIQWKFENTEIYRNYEITIIVMNLSL